MYEFHYPVPCALFPASAAQISRQAAENAAKEHEMCQMLEIAAFLKKCCQNRQNLCCSIADCETLRPTLVTGKSLICALDAFLRLRSASTFSHFASELGRFCYSGAQLRATVKISDQSASASFRPLTPADALDLILSGGIETCEFGLPEDAAQHQRTPVERIETLCWPRSDRLLELMDASDS